MSQTTTILIVATLSYLSASCGRNQSRMEPPTGGSKLATVSIKNPTDADGLLKAGTDYDSAEILFRTTEDNARWESKGTFKLDGKNDAVEKSLSFKPGIYVLNMKLINSSTKKVVAEAYGDNKECMTPKVTLKAGENAPVALKLCLAMDNNDDTVGAADVVISPEVVATEKSALKAEDVYGDFYARSPNIRFELSNSTKEEQICDSKVIWTMTLVDSAGKETQKAEAEIKSTQKVAASLKLAQNFEYKLPEAFAGRIIKAEVEIQAKCKHNKNFISLLKGSLRENTTATAK